ncbi:MAG: competence protein ComK [Solobacterium sp.]|nr:competence protein ComK [Solobacterium sp.]
MLSSSGQWQHSDQSVNRFIDDLCVQCGSTADGRREAFRRLTGYRQKVPVLISERRQYLMFPTLSPDNPECVWLSYSDILDIVPAGDAESEVLFINGTRISIPFSTRMLRKQMKRCDEYLQILDGSDCPADRAEDQKELLRKLLSQEE